MCCLLYSSRRRQHNADTNEYTTCSDQKKGIDVNDRYSQKKEASNVAH